MQQKLSLKLLPQEAANADFIKLAVQKSVQQNITDFKIVKKSIDARGKTIFVNLSIVAFINEAPSNFIPHFTFKNVEKAKNSALIIGAGPAGLFAALQLLEKGIKPIIIERGKNVRDRRRDLAALNKLGIVNPESNYCFGEGGAGTYSDGKLYTRSNKRGSIDRILQLFVYFGAPENILYDAHPHIGTNKLPQIISAMQQKIKDCGGIFLFEKKLVDFEISENKITAIKTADGDSITADNYILATGHSARDIFELLYKKNIAIEAKPFALGVRVEHRQQLIDSIQYHCKTERSEFLPPAAYSLVQQVEGRGVFSFCMCPGGIIAPAATDAGELVVNGWSPSKRNNAFANSGMVVQVEKEDALAYLKQIGKPVEENNPLIFMKFQQAVEQKVYAAGGEKFVAPAQRLVDFVQGKTSASLPINSYLPGLNAVNLKNVLPNFVYQTLAAGFVAFGKKLKGYFTNDAIVVAVESRTSSPVRIPRNAETLQHPQIANLFPCGEGAGYAGGIVSAAMDGERIANKISEKVFS
jgi:uncharacterized protein